MAFIADCTESVKGLIIFIDLRLQLLVLYLLITAKTCNKENSNFVAGVFRVVY